LQDPALEIEQEETMDGYAKDIVEFILLLPPCQQRAMICSLKDSIRYHVLGLQTAQGSCDGIREVNWPEKKEELQSLRTSLSLARKKLRLRVDTYRSL